MPHKNKIEYTVIGIKILNKYRKGTALPYSIFQLINVKEMMNYKNHHLPTLLIVRVVGKNHQWMLKLMSNFMMRIGIAACHKISPYKIFLNCKRKYGNFTVEKPDRHPHNQVIKVNVTSNKTNWYHTVLKKAQHRVCGILAKNK